MIETNRTVRAGARGDVGQWAMRIALLACVSMLAGCGGGDGDAADGADPTPDFPAFLSMFFVESFDAFEDAARALIENDTRYLQQSLSWFFDTDGDGLRNPQTEPLRQTFPLLSSGVHYAHAAGLTGAGTILSIVDDGFRPDHEVFANKTLTLQPGLTLQAHGTMVASIAAGSSATMIGVAPGADLALGSFDSFATLTDATRQAEALGAVAQNNSWGFVDAPIGAVSYNRVLGDADGQAYLAALRSYAREGVVIFAASNTATDAQSGLMPALPLLEPELAPGWIAVINGEADLVGDDIVAARRVSSACLQAAAWCMAAEGTWVGATQIAADSYDAATGTSFAAPMVAGAMALLAEAFPTLTPHQLRLRLLASADNDFDGFNATGQAELVPGFTRAISSEWGHGFLDVKAALLPIGQTTATLADGSVYDIALPLAVEGQATGNAVATALRGVSLAVDDAFSARFGVPAERLVARPNTQPLTRAMQARWLRAPQVVQGGAESWFPGAGLVHLQRDRTRLDLALPREGTRTSAGVMVGQGVSSGLGDVALGLGLGRDAGMLMPRWHGGGDSMLAVTAISLAAPLGEGASMELGTSLGLMDGAALTAARAALVLDGASGATDRLTLQIDVPVAVARGRTTLGLPVMTHGGISRQQQIAIDLAPADREIRFGLDYRTRLGEGTDAYVALAHAENRGHVAGARETGVFIGVHANF